MAPLVFVLTAVVGLVLFVATMSHDRRRTRPDPTIHPATVLSAPPPSVTPLEAALLVQGGSRGVMGEIVALARDGLVDIRRHADGDHGVVARDLGRPVPRTTGAVLRALFGDPPRSVVVPAAEPSLRQRVRGVARQAQQDLRARGLIRRTWWPLAAPIVLLVGGLVGVVLDGFREQTFGWIPIIAGLGLLLTRREKLTRLTEAGRREARHLRQLDLVLDRPAPLPWEHPRPWAPGDLTAATAMTFLPYAVVFGHHELALFALRHQLDPHAPHGGGDAGPTWSSSSPEGSGGGTWDPAGWPGGLPGELESFATDVGSFADSVVDSWGDSGGVGDSGGDSGGDGGGDGGD
ncbi:DUF2207 domain-containing protein [Kytococcus sp. Marseille-QA3725]